MNIMRKIYAKDSLDITNMIYQKTNSLEKIDYGNDKIKETFKRNFIDRVYEKEGYKVNDSVYFIIRNKNTNEIITNDPSGYFGLSAGGYTDENVRSYINEKYDGKELVISYDNEKSFSKIVEEGNIIYDTNVLANFEEYYYTSIDSYDDDGDINIVIGVSFLILIGLFLVVKIASVLIMNKGRTIIRGNFIIEYYIYIKKWV